MTTKKRDNRAKTVTVKKTVGFQALPKDKKKSVRVLTFLSEPEHKKLLKYCEGLATKPSIVIRESLKHIIGTA